MLYLEIVGYMQIIWKVEKYKDLKREIRIMWGLKMFTLVLLRNLDVTKWKPRIRVRTGQKNMLLVTAWDSEEGAWFLSSSRVYLGDH